MHGYANLFIVKAHSPSVPIIRSEMCRVRKSVAPHIKPQFNDLLITTRHKFPQSYICSTIKDSMFCDICLFRQFCKALLILFQLNT